MTKNKTESMARIDELAVVLGALAQETRIKIFLILVENHEHGVCPGDIAARLKIPRNTLSFHLSLLSHAGLCTSMKKGKMIFYKPDCDTVRKSTQFLFKNCCEMKCKKS